MRQRIVVLPAGERNFEAVQGIARVVGVNGQVAWKYALQLGFTPRAPGARYKLLTKEKVLEAEKLLSEGTLISHIAASFGTSIGALRNRLDRLAEEREDEIETKAEAARKAALRLGPNIYQSEFIRPLTLRALSGSRHPTGPTESNIQHIYPPLP